MKKSLFMLLSFVGLAVGRVVAGSVVDYSVDGVVFEGCIENAGKAAPLVVIIHDWDGLTDYEVERARMLKELGYSAFAIDLYGKGVRPTEIADRKKCMSILTGDRPKMRAYMKGALEFAASQGLNTDNCVVMGYCFGGTAVLELARSGEPLKGFATFHGGLDLPAGQDYSEAKGAYQIHHSITDGMPPFAALAEALEKQQLPAQLISYTGAPHGWTVFGSPRYREKPDQESWNHFLRFLEDTLGGK
ncbi:dienelactone hydrolase family protein [Pontiella sp.]|uniref:dienelactone hydrolase family protein n=1 Tax=Pontiella sp. TaxID=2837462 RepID=UPI003566FAC5